MDYLDINKNSWNKRVEWHLDSEFYNLNSFLKSKNSLNAIELDLLPSLKGKSLLHLQCHFGQDSISLGELGAEVIGADFSDVAIETAKRLAVKCNSKANFICSDVYSLPNNLQSKFDVVYATYGTIGWLPDIKKWAKVVSHFLKPNGIFVFVEFHPIIWMFNDDCTEVTYSYNNSMPIQEDLIGSYAAKQESDMLKTITWNHGLGEVISALIDNGLTIQKFQEYDYSPYDCFANTYEFEKSKYRISTLKELVPYVYSIVAAKN